MPVGPGVGIGWAPEPVAGGVGEALPDAGDVREPVCVELLRPVPPEPQPASIPATMTAKT
jgi:hypothetical protein